MENIMAASVLSAVLMASPALASDMDRARSAAGAVFATAPTAADVSLLSEREMKNTEGTYFSYSAFLGLLGDRYGTLFTRMLSRVNGGNYALRVAHPDVHYATLKRFAR